MEAAMLFYLHKSRPRAMLNAQDIIEFQKIFKRTFKKELPLPEAMQYAQELYELYRAVYLPVEPDNLLIKQNDERRNQNI
ncbi:MAG: hypothetical protein Q7S10_02920 [bacterium]|nr:hypothetical protein [bacterium]